MIPRGVSHAEICAEVEPYRALVLAMILDATGICTGKRKYKTADDYSSARDFIFSWRLDYWVETAELKLKPSYIRRKIKELECSLTDC